MMDKILGIANTMIGKSALPNLASSKSKAKCVSISTYGAGQAERTLRDCAKIDRSRADGNRRSHLCKCDDGTQQDEDEQTPGVGPMHMHLPWSSCAARKEKQGAGKKILSGFDDRNRVGCHTHG